MNTEADILASTYFDTCTVYRPIPAVIDGYDDFTFQKVYENIPCALSYRGMASADLESVQDINFLASLMVRPEIIIEAGDEIEVVQMGRMLKFRANEGAFYPSHNNIPLIRSERA